MKKVMAFIMIIAVSVGILTLSPVFEKEAQAASTSYIWDFYLGRVNLIDAANIRNDFNNYITQLPDSDPMKKSFYDPSGFFGIMTNDYWTYFLYGQGNYKTVFTNYMKPLVTEKAKYFIKEVYGDKVKGIVDAVEIIKNYKSAVSEFKDLKIDGKSSIVLGKSKSVSTSLSASAVIGKPWYAPLSKDKIINVTDSFDTWWISSDTSVATVYKGKVTAVKKGSTKITVWYMGKTPIKRTFNVTVK